MMISKEDLMETQIQLYNQILLEKCKKNDEKKYVYFLLEKCINDNNNDNSFAQS